MKILLGIAMALLFLPLLLVLGLGLGPAILVIAFIVGLALLPLFIERKGLRGSR